MSSLKRAAAPVGVVQAHQLVLVGRRPGVALPEHRDLLIAFNLRTPCIGAATGARANPTLRTGVQREAQCDIMSGRWRYVWPAEKSNRGNPSRVLEARHPCCAPSAWAWQHTTLKTQCLLWLRCAIGQLIIS